LPHCLVSCYGLVSTPNLHDASFFNSTDRILSPGYRPTLTDVIRAPERLNTIRETKLSLEDLNVALIEVPHGSLGRIIHQFDEVDACLLTLDLASYDRYTEENDGRNTLEQGIRLFKGICRVFSSKPIFLVCVNFKAFRDKLATSPLSIHFPDYKGGCNPTAAAKFILRRCKQLIVKDQDFFHHFAEDDAEDPSTVQFFKEMTSSLPATTYLIRALGLKPPPSASTSERYRAVFRPRQLSSQTI
jgi:guanine nucleotide-binding protein G(i) subunit alpha